MHRDKPTFLTASWRKLAMANYVVNPEFLLPFLPAGTEIDFWNGHCFVSLIGFMFLNTRLKGVKIPFHSNFEEVNIRFYVRYHDRGEWKRGVVFIKEIVPRPALTFVANTIYKEHYETCPMHHSWVETDNELSVIYRWKKGRWHSFQVSVSGTPQPLLEGSEEEFITEHYWGYTQLSANKTSEYGVQHPRWDMYAVKRYAIDVDFGQVYGNTFSFLTHEEPHSVFMADGSEIVVKSGMILKF